MTDVYYNRRRWQWSLRERGRVVGHADQVSLRDVALVVSVPAVMRVRSTGQRAVCAFARGALSDEPRDGRGELIGFDPHLHTSFVTVDGREVSGCQGLFLSPAGIAWGWGLEWR